MKTQCLISISFLLALIFVGSTVRATGSGLGCPDWPKCFGQWIPPTHVDQLPEDYRQRFTIKGQEIAEFDALKTWTEYLNRLLGMLIGIIFLCHWIYAFRRREQYPKVWKLLTAVVLLTAFQGWLGAQVVNTLLHSTVITIHLLVALVIYLLLIHCLFLVKINPKRALKRYSWFWSVLFAFGLIQFFLGIQVRHQIDDFVHGHTLAPRREWIESLGDIFYLHRSFSLIFLLMLIGHIWQTRKSFNFLSPEYRFLTFAILASIGSGMTLNYLGFPLLAQPAHLVFGVVTLGLLYWKVLSHKELI